MKRLSFVLLGVTLPGAISAQTLQCVMEDYQPAIGLSASLDSDRLHVTWAGDGGQTLRMALGIAQGTPTVHELALRAPRSAAWTVIARDVTPDFHVASGMRRITNQQLAPLRALGVEINSAVIDSLKWDAFWDAPLHVAAASEGRFSRNTPPAEGIADQPGLPRDSSEIQRVDAEFAADGCTVVTNGGRLEVSFPGLTLGVFDGELRFTVYRGTNLLRVEAVATTSQPSVAYKYRAGLRGVRTGPDAHVAWRDLSGAWQTNRLGGSVNDGPVPLKNANRFMVAQTDGGAIAAFPPPHTFFWAREVESNLGYGWYRKDSAGSFSFGIKQGEGEEIPNFYENFSLYSAPPESVQRMPVYFYLSAGSAQDAAEGALAFTRHDVFKAVPGYQVMASHFHMRLGEQLRDRGSLDYRPPDLDVLKAAGINIVVPAARPTGDDRLEVMRTYFDGARRHSDRDFLIMPGEEVYEHLGGHWDLLLAKPVFWTRDRADGQPFMENHPEYGRVYHVGNASETMDMIERENGLVFMPHARTKGSTGYPDAVKDTEHFRHERYRGIGWRWGMGLDLSDSRLSGKRNLPLLDDMNNWIADLDTRPKYLHAITETYGKAPGDDIYANNPVNYVRLDSLPTVDDMSSVINAMRNGEYFVSSGEVLIRSFAIHGAGEQRRIIADVEWTFPLEFAEVVWGDGERTERHIVSATELTPFGWHQFNIPFDATRAKWIRFAVWDSAGNGALTQPVRITAPVGGDR